MAGPAITAIAMKCHGELQTGARAGRAFDFDTILQIITELLSLFGLCGLSAAHAEQRARNVAAGKGAWHRLDKRRMRRVISNNSTDDSQNDEIEDAVVDTIDATSPPEFAAAYAEVNP